MTDILYLDTDTSSQVFLKFPKDDYHPEFPSWYWELCGCCAGRIAYSEDDFNSTQEYPDPTGYTHSKYKQDQTFNRGICVMVNPDVTKIKEIKGSVVSFIPCGEDTLAVRTMLYKDYWDKNHDD